MNAGREYETLGLETKGSLRFTETEGTRGSSFFVCCYQAEILTGWENRATWPFHTHRVCYRREALSLRNPIFFVVGCKQAHQPSLREHVIFIMLNSKQTSSVLLSETPSLFFKAVLYVNILEKITWNKGSHCLCLRDVQKHEGPMENHFPIATTFDFFSRFSHKPLN